jgi:hypothetical protein
MSNRNHNEKVRKEFSEQAMQQLGMIKAKGGNWIHQSAVGVFNINPKNFFKENDANGFTSKTDFLKLLYSLKRGQLKTLDVLFKKMSAEIYFSVYHGQRPEGDGINSVICEYEEDGVPHKVKVFVTDDMHRLLWQYSFSILKCRVSLERLYQEALSDSNN